MLKLFGNIKHLPKMETIPGLMKLKFRIKRRYKIMHNEHYDPEFDEPRPPMGVDGAAAWIGGIMLCIMFWSWIIESVF